MGPNRPLHGDDEFLEWNEIEGTFEGRAFPGESEWMNLPAPPIADDFVARTLAALRATAQPETNLHDTDWHDKNRASDQPAPANEGAAEGNVVGHLLTPDLLAAFKAPEPTEDFVARTLRAVQNDRRSRWRDLLAKYVAPEPSPEFVARTLRALADDGNRSPRPAARAGAPARWGVVRSSLSKPWFLSLVALAAALLVVVILQPNKPPPLEQRVADAARPSLASTYAANPLPAVLAALEASDDPEALPSGGASGRWLLLHREGR